MKRIITVCLSIMLVIISYKYRQEIYRFYYDNFVPIEKRIQPLNKNKYYRDYNFSYIENTNNFIPNNKQEILNIYYTIINSGETEYSFYCPKNYQNCINDVNDIANNQSILSNLNNFVHPYNSFKSIKTEINTSGQIKVMSEKNYSDEHIILIDYEIDKIIKNEINSKDSERTRIKSIHDYIIEHTKYDKNRSDNKITKYKSDTAYGVIIENYGVCGGYTDAMMLFLERMNIESIKISSENHIWNYVKLDNNWYHLDLTWDDPITSDNSDILDNTYFLINNNQLKKIDSIEHLYDESIYK